MFGPYLDLDSNKLFKINGMHTGIWTLRYLIILKNYFYFFRCDKRLMFFKTVILFFFEFLYFILFIFLYSRFLLVIHFIHISVYMSIPISQFIPPPHHHHHFPPLVSIHLFSASVSLFLPCKPVHLYHFSRFHIYALIYDICKTVILKVHAYIFPEKMICCLGLTLE